MFCIMVNTTTTHFTTVPFIVSPHLHNIFSMCEHHAFFPHTNLKCHWLDYTLEHGALFVFVFFTVYYFRICSTMNMQMQFGRVY